MKGTIIKRRLSVHIVQALIWATAWLVILWANEYPLNEWVGVVGIGYLAWFVSHALMDNGMRYALSRGYGYAVGVYGEPKDKQTSLNKRMAWTVAFLSELLIYGVGFFTSGLMFIFTWLGLIALDFPTLDTNIGLVGLLSVALGSIMMLLPFATVIYMLELSKNHVSIRERVTYVIALAWPLITKERFMPKLGFGLDSQHIEKSTV